MLLLLLSRFSRVRLCATPEMADHQARPSLGFSRQEHWSGLSFPSPMHESEKWKGSRSVVSDPQRPWTAAYHASPSMGFSRQEYWSGLPLPSPTYPLDLSKIFWKLQQVKMCEPNTFPWIILKINLQKKIIWSQKGKCKVVGKEMKIRVSRKYSLLYKTMVWLDNHME